MNPFLMYPVLPGSVKFRTPDGVFFITPEGRDCVNPRLLRRIDSCFERGVLLKDTRSTTAALAAVSHKGTPVFLKRTNNKGLIFSLKYLFRCSRVFRAARAAFRLDELGIRTPRVLLAGERRRGLILKAGYLVTTTAPEIHSVAWLLRETGAPEAVLESFLAYAAESTARLHAGGLEHGDLKTINFYFTGQWGPETEYGIWDLDSVRCHKSGVPLERIEKELARVVFSTHLSAGNNPCFSKEICSPEYIAHRLTELYRQTAGPGVGKPEEEAVLRHAVDRLEYLKIHPYKPSKTELR